MFRRFIRFGSIIATVCVLFSISRGQDSNAVNRISSSDSVPGVREAVKVSPFGRTLFHLYTSLGPFPVEARARQVEIAIQSLAQNPFYNPDSLIVAKKENIPGIVYMGNVISVVTQSDVNAENLPREKILRQRMNMIREAVEDYRVQHRRENIIRGLLYPSIALVLLVLVFILVRKLFRFIEKKISVWKGSPRIKLKIMNYDLLDLNRQVRFLLVFTRFFRNVTFLIAFILGLLILFYLLPWTKNFTLDILDIVISPVKLILQGILNYIPNVIIIGVIFVIMTYVNRFFRFLKREIEEESLKLPGFYPEWALPTYNIIRVIVWIFTLILIWPYIPGSDSRIFQGISVFIGLVFSLTSASLFSNLMAGFTLTYTKAFRIGDRIQVGELTGDVIEKSMLVTRIRTIKNEEITIPNSKIMNSEVINYSEEAASLGVILYTSVTIGYDAPWRTVHDLLIRAALATNDIEKTPTPFVLQTALNDFYVSYQINGYTKNPSRMAIIYSELHQNIQDSFNEAGVEIMSPHYNALRDGNTIAIPENYRNKNYVAPSFRIRENPK